MRPGFFAGGRAPGSWLRAMSRAVAPLQALRRSTAWLGELAGARPRLRAEPLLGSTLAAVALRELPARSPEPQAARSGRRRSGAADGALPRRLRSREIARIDKRKHLSSMLRVGAGLDGREEARPALETRGRSEQGGSSPQPTVQTRPYPKPGDRAAGAPRGETHSPGNLSDPETSRDWLRDLGRRAVRALRRGLPEEERGRALIAHEASVVIQQRAPSAEPGRPAVPAEPWETDFQGEQAPADLLRRWTAPAPPRPSETIRREGPAAIHPGRVEPPSGRPAPALPEAASAPGPISAAPPHPGPPGEVPASTSDAPAAAVLGLLEAALPPLLPPRDSGPSAPWKAPAQAPAAVGRLEAEMPEEEDLSRLAAGIKRILDEEARRHGIDV